MLLALRPAGGLWSGHFHFGRARMARVGVMKLKVPPWRIGNLPPPGQVKEFKVRGQWSVQSWDPRQRRKEWKRAAHLTFSMSYLLFSLNVRLLLSVRTLSILHWEQTNLFCFVFKSNFVFRTNKEVEWSLFDPIK